ncbi:mediator of RNA polymerase II transcription subunit 15a-like [Primulina tabacum]|uniref:mediator of RNA polymerase II transcription subunit 15a-like n=1 Tax=Primulina tabacum TaxID=48773 RepID=UPI003F5AD6C9
MDDGNGKSSAETEPSFNLDEWMKELLPNDEADDATEFGMGQAGMLLPSPSVNNLSQENKSVLLEKSHQIAATSSIVLPSVCQNSKPMVSTSGSSITQRQNIPSSLSTKYSDFSETQTSCNMVSQVHQRHQFQHQLLMQPTNRLNVQSSALHSNSHLSNRLQQQPIHQKESPTFGMPRQQHKIGNQSSSFMMNNQESFNVVQHSDQSTSHKQIMQLPQKMQLQPELQRTTFLHSQNVMAIDPKMSAKQSQPIHVGSSQGLLNYNAQVGLINSSDWVDPAFQQIQFMKEMYMSEVIKLFERSQELRHQATSAESVAKHERNRTFSEKIIRFLQLSKMDLMMNYGKERVYSMINEVRAQLDRAIAKNHPLRQHPQQLVEMSGGMLKTSQMQQRPNFLQYKMSNQCLNSTRKGMPPYLRQQGTNKFQIGPSIGLRKGDTSSITNSNTYNLMGSGFHKGVVEQMARNMLLHPLSGATHSNDTTTLHQRVASSKNIFNSLDSSVSSITQKSISTSPQQHDQAMEIPNAKQPLQQPVTGKNKHQMVPKLNNGLKYGYISGFNQNQSSSSSFHVGSPQNSQHSSTYIEPKDLSSTFSNSATQLLPTSSPPVVPSPLTPLTPSSAPVDSEKSHSRMHSLSLEERRRVHQIPAPLSQLKSTNQNQYLKETGLLKSPLLAESTSPVVNQPSRSNEYPLRRLIEVVKSVSSKSLNSSLRDISAVTNITDRTTRSLSHIESDRIFVQDLSDDIRNHEEGNFSLIYGTGIETRIKRQLSTMVSDDSISEMELNADSRMKRLKKEPSDLILQEIQEINQMLIESVVDVINTKDVFRAEAGKEILIRCCYSPVGFAGAVRIPGSSENMFPTMLLELIVTPDYPNSSPVVSEALPLDFSGDEEEKDLWMKAKSIFSLSLRKCSQHPISLKEMAKTWDASAREVFQEFAEQRGGGSFSSRYGKWKNDIASFPVS